MQIQEVTRADMYRKDCVLFYHIPDKAEYYYYPDSVRKYFDGLYKVKIKVVKLPYMSDTERQVVISNVNIDYSHRQFKIINSVTGIENITKPKSDREIGDTIHSKAENKWQSAAAGPISKLLDRIIKSVGQ